MTRYLRFILGALLVTLLLIPRAGAQAPQKVKYEGIWRIQDNGDVNITLTYELGLEGYVYLKQHNAAMLAARNFASSRAAAEFVDMNAEWNDMKHVLKMSMTGLGFAINRGDHWEAKVSSNIEFSNIDSGTKIVHFSCEADGPMGHIVGHDQLVLPPRCTRPTYDASTRTISYLLPTKTPASFSFLLTLGIAAAVIGIGALGASFLFPPAKPAAVPPTDISI